MDQHVNTILGSLKSLGYKIEGKNILKKKGKTFTCKEIYLELSEKIKELDEITPTQFQEIIKNEFIRKQEFIPTNNNSMDSQQQVDIFKTCKFVINRFRWFITEDKVCLYYLKEDPNIEQYKYLTSDETNKKFYNSLPVNEKQFLQSIILEYNNNQDPKPSKPITSPKRLLQQFISEIDNDADFQLPWQPIPLSNNPMTPCTKFVDIYGIEAWGDSCIVNGDHASLDTSAWDGFCSRIREQDMVPLFKAYIAGLAVEYNTTKQALYIYGNGDDGKSKVTQTIRAFFGEGITFSLPQTMKSNQFTMMDAYGKRIFLGEELQSPNVIMNGMLHAILGGSIVRLEPKGEPAFSAKVYANGVITSNHTPSLKNVKNQITRLMFIEMNPPTQEEINTSGNAWAQALQTQFVAFLYKGFKEFKRLNPSGASFCMPANYSELIEELFDEKSIRMKEYIDNVFYFSPGASIRCRLGKNFREYVSTEYVDDLKNGEVPLDYFDNKIEKEIFEKLLMKFPLIRKSTIRTPEGKKVKTISGLAVNIEYNAILLDFDPN